MVFSISAKNPTQIQIADRLNVTVAGDQRLGRVINATVGLYTVPASTRTLVKSITGIVDAVGGDASYSVAIRRGGTFFPLGAFVVVNEKSEWIGVMLLNAGDIVTNVGDAGATNGTIDMGCSIQEFND